MFHINNFRGFAIILIVLTHAIEMFKAKHSVLVSFDYLIGNGTYYFVFISGYIFFRSTVRFDLKAYFSGKIQYVLIPYTLFSIPALILCYLEINQYIPLLNMAWYYDLPWAARYVALYLTGTQLGPFWFIPTIMIIYAVSPAMLVLKRRSVVTTLFLIVLIFALAVLIGRGNPVRSAIFFMPAFLIGFAVSQLERAGRTLPFERSGLYFFAAAALMVAVPYGSSLNGQSAALFNQFYCLTTTLALYVLFRSRVSSHNKFLDLFARLSFYIYFSHGFFILAFRRLVEDVSDSAYQVPIIVGTVVATLVLCILTYALFKWVLNERSRRLIGA